MFMVLTCKCYYPNMLGVSDWTECSVTMPFKHQVQKAFHLLKTQSTAGVEFTWIEYLKSRQSAVLFFENYEDRQNNIISVKLYTDGKQTDTYKQDFEDYKHNFYRRAKREEWIQ